LRVRAVRVAGERTGRIGVIVAPGGERSFVADRAAADRLLPEALRHADVEADLLHLPAYSLLGEPLGAAGRRSIVLARASHALVSLDLASVGPLLAGGRQAATSLVKDAAPDILFATTAEAEALAGGHDLEVLSEFARLVVIKRGRGGATVFAPASGSPSRWLAFDVATSSVEAPDTTGAGDAFDAGFLAAFLASPDGERGRPAALRRAVLAGHRTAARQLIAGSPELTLG
jgi:sugar/nucleoside kinase (ribokinase family)